MDNIYKDSYTSKVFEKLEEGTIDMFANCTFKCPFDDNPEDGSWESTVDHARHALKHGMGYRTRANHTALLKHLIKEVHDDNDSMC